MHERHSGCTTLLELVRMRAERSPDDVAYTHLLDRPGQEQTVTYRALDHRARATAAFLQRAGAQGEPVPILYATGLEFVAAYLGCVYAGALPCPLPKLGRPLDKWLPRTRAVILDSGARVALASADTIALAPEIREAAPDLGHLEWIDSEGIAGDRADDWARPRLERDTPAVIQYTSGSTATPKGVLVTHGNVLHSCFMMEDAWRLGPDSTLVSWLPMFHDMGLVFGALLPLYQGCTGVVMAPETFVRAPRRWLEAISRFGGTHAMAPNFAFELCVRRIPESEREGLDLSSWRVAANASEPVRQRTMTAFFDAYRPHGLRADAAATAYGLAESTLPVSATSIGRAPATVAVRRDELERGQVVPVEDAAAAARTLVSAGPTLVETDIAIVDPDTRLRCPADAVGEIWVAGDTVARGYFRRREDTARTFAAHVEDTGEGPFMRTGDLGFFRGGELFVAGRLKDLIIIRGNNFHPEDLEATVEAAHETVRPSRAAAFSVDADDEERLVVVAELERSAAGSLASIADRVGRHIVRAHQVEPHELVFVNPSTIPRTSSGKIQRRECRARYLAGRLARFEPEADDAAASAPPASAPIDARCREIEAQLLAEIETLARGRIEGLSPELELGQLGLDSVKLMELAAFLEREHDLVAPAAALQEEISIRTLVVRLVREQAGETAGEDGRARPEAPAKTPPRARGAEGPANAPPAAPAAAPAPARRRPGELDVSLFFFANDETRTSREQYRLFLDSSALADRLGFTSVWVPERHFHPFGGAYPNPSVAAAALAMRTESLRVRAGSVVLPLHDPVRVAEEWSLVDNLSGGRVDLAFASGWAANDFSLQPQNYADRKQIVFEHIETVRRLWEGGSITRENGLGKPFELSTYPRPVQRSLSPWFTCTGPVDSFLEAGARGYNVLTALLFQSVDELAAKIALYRNARASSGHDPDTGTVTLALHTFLSDSVEKARRVVREPFMRYLRSSVDLWRHDFAHLGGIDGAQKDAALELAFERYFGRAALFGTPASCEGMVRQLEEAGVGEIACLIDFGVDREATLESLSHVAGLRRRVLLGRQKTPAAGA